MQKFKYISNATEICQNLKKESDLFCIRLIKNKTPNESDFIPAYYLKQKNECLAKGLSLFEDIKDIETMFELMPNLKKKYKSMYKAKIKEEDGCLYSSPAYKKPSHKTFYAFKDCDELEIFTEEINYEF